MNYLLPLSCSWSFFFFLALPTLAEGWNAMVNEGLQENGFSAYVQSTGKEPKDGQPLSINKIPDFEDCGLGCFLLAGSEVYKMEVPKMGPTMARVQE